MEVSLIRKKLEERGVPSELSPFGRGSQRVFVLKPGDLRRGIAAIMNEEGLKIDCLDFVSAYERDQALALTYFFRSSVFNECLQFRAFAPLEKESDRYAALSVREYFATASIYEREIARLYGARFEGADATDHIVWEPGVEGFPLRAAFAWKAEA